MPIEANIIEGIYFKVGGDAGRTNGLSWPILEEMGYHLQELITLLAKYNLIDQEPPKLSFFEIELYDFQRSSAVPAFRLVPKNNELIPIIGAHRETVAGQFDTLLSIANEGNYEKYFNQFQTQEVISDIAEEIYKFRTSVGKSPMTVVKPVRRDEVINIYEINPFTKEQVEKLLPAKKAKKATEEAKEILGLIRKVGSRNKIIDLYEGSETTVSFAPTRIVTLEKVYNLHFALLCQVFKEDDHWVIQNEMLDIYASGSSINEAEFDFYNEFDESFKFFEFTPDDQLSERLLSAKAMMKMYIQSITEN